MECASLKHGIITAILRRDSSNESAAPGSIFGERLTYYSSCLSLDALNSRPRTFYIFGKVHLCSKVGVTLMRGTTLYRNGPHTPCEAPDSTAPSFARLRPRRGCTSGSRLVRARDQSAPGPPRKRSACRPE